MLYEAATGALPQGAFAPPSQMNRVYGRAFDRVVTHLLQADPARRPAAAAGRDGAVRGAGAGRPRARAIALWAGAMVLRWSGEPSDDGPMFRGDETGQEVFRHLCDGSAEVGDDDRARRRHRAGGGDACPRRARQAISPTVADEPRYGRAKTKTRWC